MPVDLVSVEKEASEELEEPKRKRGRPLGSKDKSRGRPLRKPQKRKLQRKLRKLRKLQPSQWKLLRKLLLKPSPSLPIFHRTKSNSASIFKKSLTQKLHITNKK